MFLKPKFLFDLKYQLSIKRRSRRYSHVSKTDFGPRKTAILSIFDKKLWVCTHDFFQNFWPNFRPVFQGLDSQLLGQKSNKIGFFEKVSLAQFSMFPSFSASKEPYERCFGVSAKNCLFWACFCNFSKGFIRKSQVKIFCGSTPSKTAKNFDKNRKSSQIEAKIDHFDPKSAVRGFIESKFRDFWSDTNFEFQKVDFGAIFDRIFSKVFCLKTHVLKTKISFRPQISTQHQKAVQKV